MRLFSWNGSSILLLITDLSLFVLSVKEALLCVVRSTCIEMLQALLFIKRETVRDFNRPGICLCTNFQSIAVSWLSFKLAPELLLG